MVVYNRRKMVALIKSLRDPGGILKAYFKKKAKIKLVCI